MTLQKRNNLHIIVIQGEEMKMGKTTGRKIVIKNFQDVQKGTSNDSGFQNCQTK